MPAPPRPSYVLGDARGRVNLARQTPTLTEVSGVQPLLAKRQGFPSGRRYVGGARHVVDIPVRGLRPLGPAGEPKMMSATRQVTPRHTRKLTSTET